MDIERDTTFIQQLLILESQEYTADEMITIDVTERDIQLKLQKELGGFVEFPAENGRFKIDLLVVERKELFEIKYFKSWYHALGQIRVYGRYFPGYKLIIYLFGKISQKEFDICKKHLDFDNIELRIEVGDHYATRDMYRLPIEAEAAKFEIKPEIMPEPEESKTTAEMQFANSEECKPVTENSDKRKLDTENSDERKPAEMQLTAPKEIKKKRKRDVSAGNVLKPNLEVSISKDQGVYYSTSLSRLLSYVNNRYQMQLNDSVIYKNFKQCKEEYGESDVKGATVRQIKPVFGDEWKQYVISRGFAVHEGRSGFV